MKWRYTTIKRSVTALLMMFGLIFALEHADAQDYPSRAIKIIVPNAPGGSSDIAGRTLAQYLSTVWHQPVVVENKPGANTAIAVSSVIHAPADGYTLLLGTPSLSTFKVYLKDPGFDVKKDLAPISELMVSPFVIAVNARLPVANMAQFIELAKKNPGKLNYGAFGGGQILATELFKKEGGIDIVKVPYQSETPAVLGLANNEVQLVFATGVTVRPMLETGRVKVLAVSTETRSAAMPNIPTVKEAGGPQFDVGAWFGLMAPANTSMEIQRKLAAEVANFAKKPEIVKRFLPLGFTLKSSTPKEFGRLISTDIQRWTEVARFAGIAPQ